MLSESKSKDSNPMDPNASPGSIASSASRPSSPFLVNPQHLISQRITRQTAKELLLTQDNTSEDNVAPPENNSQASNSTTNSSSRTSTSETNSSPTQLQDTVHEAEIDSFHEIVREEQQRELLDLHDSTAQIGTTSHNLPQLNSTPKTLKSHQNNPYPAQPSTSQKHDVTPMSSAQPSTSNVTPMSHGEQVNSHTNRFGQLP